MKSAIHTLTQHPDIYLGNAADAAQSPIERLPLGVKALDTALAGGIPSAGLSRIRCHQGSGELQLLHPVFAAQRNTGKKVIWLYRHQSINPVWLAKHQLLTDSWLLSPANEQDALWACEQCIRSQACSLIVYSYASLNAKAARRLQVLSKQYQCLLLNIDYNLQTFMSLPVNVDCELYYKDTQWYITLHRVVGSWPKSDIPICNPLPASNDAIITAMRETQSASVSTLTGSQRVSPMQWLYAHFPSLQLDHFVLEQAEDKQAALVVFCPQHNEILQVSQCASTAGIKRGMGLAQACALLNRIQLIPYSAEVECQQLHLLANQLYRIASDIVLLEPQGIAIKLDPIIHYYHSVDNFVALFHHVLQSTALRYHFASGPSVEAAQVLALAGADTVYLSNAQALIALQNVSLKYTQFTSKQVSQFDRMGIRTLQAVFQIPLEEVGKRFDNALISYLLALKGNKAVPRATFHPKQHFRYQCELPYELEDSVKLLRFLTQPVEQCCEYLVSQNLTTDSLQLTLHLADSPKQHVEVRAGAPMHNAKDWLSLITLKLEQLALTSAIRGFQLRCEHTVVFHATSEHLFAVRFNQHAENMLMGTLLAKLGSGAVITPRVCHDHRQDLHIRHGLPHPGAVCEQLPSGQHPCWLLIEPQPLSTQTKIVYGPERIQTGWWDDSAVKRDYFIALSSTGQRLWIFRDHQSNWFVHGYFSQYVC